MQFSYLREFVIMAESVSDFYDKGLAWDAEDNLIDQGWHEYREKVLSTHGGVGIAAADFNELLRYGHGRNQWRRRQHFTRLVRGASGDEDLDLLTKILAVMMIEPLQVSLDGGWFIHRLRTESDQFDARRAALILNRLYSIHFFAAQVLSLTLRAFCDTYENGIMLVDEILATGLLSPQAKRLLEEPPRAFLAYAREDAEKAEELHRALTKEGIQVWMDTHDLLPGENWESKIQRAFREHEFVIICLSVTSVSKRGYFQVELRTAKQMQRQRSTSDVCMLPVKLDQVDDIDIPEELLELTYVDLAQDWDGGIKALVTSMLTHHR